MAVTLDSTQEHPSTTSYDGNDPHNATVSIAGSDGLVVLLSGNFTATTHITGVTYGGVAMTLVGEAFDTAGEDQGAQIWVLPDVSGAADATLSIEKQVGGIGTWFVAHGVSADSGVWEAHVPGLVTVTENGAWAEVNVDDGSPGTNSQRVGVIFTGLAAPPAVGANTTLGGSIDVGQSGCAACFRTSPGQGSLPVGFSTASEDDRAGVFIALREVTGGGGDPEPKHLALLGVG